MVAKHEFTHSKWEELSQLIMQLWNGQDPKQKEVGTYLGGFDGRRASYLLLQFPLVSVEYDGDRLSDGYGCPAGLYQKC